MPNDPWTYNVPYVEFPGQSSNTTRGGHPTAVGPNDPYVFTQARAGSRDIGNGSPGIPRLIPNGRNGSAIPGEFGRIIQPDTNYNGGTDISGS
jgi:hypothetical protein